MFYLIFSFYDRSLFAKKPGNMKFWTYQKLIKIPTKNLNNILATISKELLTFINMIL